MTTICRKAFTKVFLLLFVLHPFIRTSAQEMPFALSKASQYPKYEMRAVWITVLSGLDWPNTNALSPQSIAKQKKEICEQLDQFKAANFNTILMQTRVRGDVIYPSQIEPYTDALTGTCGKDPGYDPLAFIIDECHKRGMEFHAWVVAIPLGSDKHIRNQGNKSIARKKPSICMHYRGYWYLNPGHPEAKEYLFSVVKEIVSRYDVDGINFDYIRYPDGRTRIPDQSTFRKYGKGKTLAQWRRDNITEMVRYIYKGVKELKPYVKIGSSPLGKYRDTNRYSSRGWNAYNTVFQDARYWLEEGIHDVICPMVYFREENFYPFVLDWKENCNGRIVVPGLGVYFLEEANWPLSDVEQQIYFTRSAGVPGQAYFRARFLLNNVSGLFDTIKREVYPYPALVPAMKWQDSIPPTHPANLTVKEENGMLTLSWDASQDNSTRSANDTGIRYQVYASSTTPVDITKPQHLLATGLKETHYTIEAEKGKGLHFDVTAVDCYGNESLPEKTTASMQQQSSTGFSHIVSVPEIPEACFLIVSDAYGRELLKQPYQRELNTSALEKGAYTLRITDAKGVTLKKEMFLKVE